MKKFILTESQYKILLKEMSDDIARAIPTIISESDYITTIAQGCSHAQLQSLRMKKIVRVQEHHKLPRDYLHTRISCRRKPSVLLAHDPKPLVFRSKIQSNRARRVRAAVIDNNYLNILHNAIVSHDI